MCTPEFHISVWNIATWVLMGLLFLALLKLREARNKTKTKRLTLNTKLWGSVFIARKTKTINPKSSGKIWD